jgi:hypothetical protein
MPFLARVKHQRRVFTRRTRRGSRSVATLNDLIDRVNATTAAATQAEEGVKTSTWRDFISNNPDLQDPFARIIQAAPDIAEEATRAFLDATMSAMEKSGLQGELQALTDGLENYYAYRDSAGNACTFNAQTGNFQSPQGLPCSMVTVAGGGLSVVKSLIEAQTAGARGEISQKIDQAVSEGLQFLLRAPQQYWTRLDDAWKATILLAGLTASSPAAVGLKIDGGNIEFNVPGIGELSINDGQIRTVAATLPPVSIRGLTVEGSGEIRDGQREGSVRLVVPIRQTTVTTTASGGPGQSTLTTTAQRQVGERGTLQAGYTTSTSRVPAQYSLAASTTSRSGNISANAGVTVARTRTGRPVQAASVNVTGSFPTLNRRIRQNQQGAQAARQAQLQAREDKQARENEIVAELQGLDTNSEQYRRLWNELQQIRRDLGSANIAPQADSSNILLGMGLVGAALIGFLHYQSKDKKNDAKQ